MTEQMGSRAICHSYVTQIDHVGKGLDTFLTQHETRALWEPHTQRRLLFTGMTQHETRATQDPPIGDGDVDRGSSVPGKNEPDRAAELVGQGTQQGS